MARILALVFVAGVLGALGAWLADHPGDLRLVWEGWEVRTSVGALLLALGLVVVAVAIVQRLWLWAGRGPGRFVAGRRGSRRERGLRALGQGLVAVAAGDGAEARRLARRARGDLGEGPLTLLLDAQSAQVAGDEGTARAVYQRMLEAPETELFALRSLAQQAAKAGDGVRALELARRARQARPHAPWPLVAVADFALQAGRWGEAEAALGEAVKHKAIARDEGDRRRAVARLAEAREEQAAGRREQALVHAREAHRLAPDLAPAAALLAELLRAEGKAAAAGRAIEETWRLAPHPELARAYANGTTDVLQRLRLIEKLATARSDHPEARIAVAEAAIAAGLWGEARRQLAPLLDGTPSSRVFRLMAEVEEKERGAGAEARAWLLRAATAPSDDGWRCRTCGAAGPSWAPACPACGTVDGLGWGAPPRGVALPAST